MRDTVAVRVGADIVDFRLSLKRDALLFNRIAIPCLDLVCRHLNELGLKNQLNEIEYLTNHELVFDAAIDPTDDSYLRTDGFYPMYLLGIERIKANIELEDFIKTKIVDSVRLSGEILRSTNDLSEDEKMAAIRELRLNQAASELLARGFAVELCLISYHARFASLHLRRLRNLDAYPLFSTSDWLLLDQVATKGDVIQIVANALPMPDDSTPWEQIEDFRNDAASISKLLELRSWMSEVATAKLSLVEVKEKLEYLVDAYERNLKFHRMKINSTGFETLVVGSAEIFENLVKLNLEKLTKGLFSLRHRRIALLESELNAPGKEVAYVLQARERFQNSRKKKKRDMHKSS